MALLPTISELTVLGVADRGVPNKERVVLRPTETVSLSEFMLIAGWVNPEGGIVPIPDASFWLGNLQLAPPSWLYVYTGAGKYSVSKISSTNHPVHVFHWGRKNVLFDDDSIQPVLLRLGGIGQGGVGRTEAPMTEAEFATLLAALGALSKSPTVTAPPKGGTPGIIDPPPGGPPKLSDIVKKKP